VSGFGFRVSSYGVWVLGFGFGIRYFKELESHGRVISVLRTALRVEGLGFRVAYQTVISQPSAAERKRNNLKVVSCVTRKSGPDSGPDCLIVLQIARERIRGQASPFSRPPAEDHVSRARGVCVGCFFFFTLVTGP